MTTLLIIDDSEIFRSRARPLAEAAGFTVVGEAATAGAGKLAARELDPDVVLLDVQLPDRDGIDLAGELAKRSQIVLISSRRAEAYGARLTHSGARGFIYKPELTPASLRAVAGEGV